MADYTPTTEEIRRAVTSFNEYFDHPRAAEFDGDLFDRWLAEVKAQERERIITLLEAKLTTAKELFDDSDGFESHVGNRYSGMIMAYETAIDLINGEEQ